MNGIYLECPKNEILFEVPSQVDLVKKKEKFEVEAATQNHNISLLQKCKEVLYFVTVEFPSEEEIMGYTEMKKEILDQIT